MFCLPMQVDGKHGLDLVAGGKNEKAAIGWFEAPANSRRLADWKWHPLCQVGWVMSLVASDMDEDGDLDILASDRKGSQSGCFWLENEGPNAGKRMPWNIHRIGGFRQEVMFLTEADLNRDGLRDIIVAVRPREIIYLRRLDRRGRAWETHPIPLAENTGGSKAVNAGDIDLDGKPDLVFICEGATPPKSGVLWLAFDKSPLHASWTAHEISGSDGIKHDLVQLIDLDGDGDLDVITCEETKGLGVFWCENPTVRKE
ncbi:MAG: VCBS repeat-containing protein [Verrucomicrobia bacterium]|nr:VCBS repeat-containing protein [Verrucomicrobiota bacterium]